MLILVFFIPGVYGVSVSISGGQGGSSFFDTTAFDAQDSDSLSVNSIISGPVMAQDASGIGDLHKSFIATNHKGEKAQITADVVNAGSWDYTQPFIDVGDYHAGLSGFLLNAIDANSIKCVSSASNRLGENARASTEVSFGSLQNYQANPYASSTDVNAPQSFDSADGTLVAINERASTPIGSTTTNTNVVAGEINGYSNEGLTFANPYFVESYGSIFGNASGEAITSESSAYKTCGYKSNDRIDIAGTESYLGHVENLFSAAGVGFGFETGAAQALETADGGKIDISSSSSNPKRDVSSTNLEILGTEIQPGMLNGYYDLTESFQDGVFAEDELGAEGDEIHLSSSASNKVNDKANVNVNVIGEGHIAYYEGQSSSFGGIVSATNQIMSLDPSNPSLAGNDIEFDASVSNLARSSARVSTHILNGHIDGTISNDATVDNTMGNQLTAMQGATNVSGTMMQIDATAIKAATLKKNLNEVLVNPSDISYDNFAGVSAGGPTVSHNVTV
jgi:hypothetical protein